MKKIYFKVELIVLSIISLGAPALAMATTNSLCDLAQLSMGYFNIGIQILVGLAVLVFVFNVFRYFFMNKENKERGMYVLWSLIGFFVIIAFWGLVNLISNSFSLNTSAPTIFGNVFGGGSTPCGSSRSSNSSSNSSPQLNSQGNEFL
ncbi:MAG: hypothetical protein KGJ35_02635 [Patescibacteria group bacterium]|nr:hypothetical protein [Patescibacteria group bacterium]